VLTGGAPRAPRRPSLAAVLLGVALLLLGGVIAAGISLWLPGELQAGTARVPGPVTSESTNAPVPPSVSDKEVLASARTTYEAFLGVTDTIIAEGGIDPDRIDRWATPRIAELEKESIETFKESGNRMEGRARVASATLQSHSARSEPSLDIATIYVCVDVSAVDIINPEGQSTVAETRPDRIPFVVTLASGSENETHMLVSSKTVWSGEGVC
jgi:hypothetical protein